VREFFNLFIFLTSFATFEPYGFFLCDLKEFRFLNTRSISTTPPFTYFEFFHFIGGILCTSSYMSWCVFENATNIIWKWKIDTLGGCFCKVLMPFATCVSFKSNRFIQSNNRPMATHKLGDIMFNCPPYCLQASY